MLQLHTLWNKVPDSLKRVLHTFWQAAGAALLTGFLAAHSSQDVKAVVFTAGATGLAAVKALLLS